MLKVGRAKAKALLAGAGAVRLVEWCPVKDGVVGESAIPPRIQGWRSVAREQSNALMFEGGSWLYFDKSECYVGFGKVEIRFPDLVMVYEVEGL